ncbi:SRPBCC family protein [Siccirubricoccus sp. KC 17139]|uniref:SRPBCC family protein n=1 Tax=Siccirubricoccus soli TaxID=2899147 RepID=A0ABT1D0J1_9PROT|nr:SRPBCC family protein [Siccirubricoccus soli]MCO6415392.1 SRPBCC family protein [Siccirubricoccus soli]MCP2681524.1 SRPBCC family protein [Siccirubricoccus soli]
MAEYTGRIEIEHPAGEVFAFLADPRHLPRYLPTVTHVEPHGLRGDRLAVAVEGEMEGHRYRDTGWLRVAPKARRLDWGSDTHAEYGGSLTVEEAPQGTVVAVSLHTTPSPAAAARLEREASNVDHGMRLALERVLGSIKAACEAAPRAVDPDRRTDDMPDSRVFGSTATLDPEI